MVGHLRIGTADEVADAHTRSHLADGRVVGWYGDPAYVVDAELADQPVPPALAARHGTHDFWGRWTRAECGAKLADVPITLWIAAHGLTAGDHETSTVSWAGVVASVARTL